MHESLKICDPRDHVDEQTVPPWMLTALELNAPYAGWRPGAGCMRGFEHGDDGGLAFPSWSDFSCSWTMNARSICAAFYFSCERDREDCPDCRGTGLNAATCALADAYLDWYDRITQDELDALWEADRFARLRGVKPTPAEVNAANGRRRRIDDPRLQHDAINRDILVRTRAKRLGIFGWCATCDHKGYRWTEGELRLALTLWILHPAVGASRGIVIRRVEQSDLPAVCRWLADEGDQNTRRFEPVALLEFS